MRHPHLLALILLFAAPCFAQETPEWQFFGGYSFQRADVREYFKTTPIIYTFRHDYVNMNGWDFAVTENRNRWFGGTLDLSGYYKTPQLGTVSNQEQLYSILYGPKLDLSETALGRYGLRPGAVRWDAYQM